MSKPLFSVTIKDCRVDTFRCPGKGGQNVNKVSSGVRVVHEASGASAESCTSRDQFRNKREAFKRMAQSKQFQHWAYRKAAEISTGQSIDDIVIAQMIPENIKVEVRTEDGWRVVPYEV